MASRSVGLAEDLAAVIAELTDGNPIIVGHSMGGMGALALIGERNDVAARLGGLVLVSSAARASANRFATAPPSARMMALARRVLTHHDHGLVLMRPGFGTSPSLTELAELRRSWLATPDETLLGFIAALAEFDLLAGIDALAAAGRRALRHPGSRDPAGGERAHPPSGAPGPDADPARRGPHGDLGGS